MNAAISQQTRIRKPQPLFARLMPPLLALLLLQGGVFLASSYGAGVNQRLMEESYRLLSNQIEHAAAELTYYLHTASQDVPDAAANANRLILSVVEENGIDPKTLNGNYGAIERILEQSMQVIRDYLPRNPYASGAFIMLDASAEPGGGDTARVHVRNAEPQGFAPTSDSFFTEPLRMARESAKPARVGYWSSPLRLSPDGDEVIAFTVPLLLEDGMPYGVFGIEISTGVINDLLPGYELNSMQGFFLLTPSQTLTEGWYLANSPLAGRFMHANPASATAETIGGIPVQFYTSGQGKSEKVAALSRQIPLYRTDTENVSWMLHGFVPRDQMEASATRVNQATLLSLVIAFLASIVMLVFIANNITSPVSRLSAQINALDPNRPVTVASTGIKEVDDLTGALERLSTRAVTTASRLSTIVHMVGIALGGFEEDHVNERVFLTETLVEMLSLDIPGDGYMPLAQWRALLAEIRTRPEEGCDGVYQWKNTGSVNQRFLRIEAREESGGALGVIVDVTAEVLEKRRLEYERDNDALTGLPNRRNFREKAQEILDIQPDKAGALIVCDLDDLKYVNDTFGHDCGDAYIRMMAQALWEFAGYGGLVARISGDEFVVLLHGFSSESDIRDIIQTVFEHAQTAFFNLFDGTKQGLRYSTGISWFPKDSRSLDSLIRFADFSMNEIKQIHKGTIGEFDPAAYESKSFLMDKYELFNLMLEEEQMAFAMQPIVNARTGEVDAYEALMRPRTPGLGSPLEVLQLAVDQSKLYRVEKLVVFKVFEWIEKNLKMLDGKKILFNTIASQRLVNEDLDELLERYGYLMKHTVMEITESEQSSPDILTEKVSIVRAQGGEIAIDDYGSGYSNELIILMTSPDMIKIDMTIIRDVDHDPDRQQIVKNAIAYAKPRGILVLGEGVETFEEMKYLIGLGVDYLQGYYLGKPKYTLEAIPEETGARIREISGATGHSGMLRKIGGGVPRECATAPAK